MSLLYSNPPIGIRSSALALTNQAVVAPDVGQSPVTSPITPLIQRTQERPTTKAKTIYVVYVIPCITVILLK